MRSAAGHNLEVANMLKCGGALLRSAKRRGALLAPLVVSLEKDFSTPAKGFVSGCFPAKQEADTNPFILNIWRGSCD